jgi:ABC-2 type transport system permease protein
MADVRTTAVPVLAALADPATGTRRTLTAGETLSQTMSMAWRALKKMRRNPEQFFDVTWRSTTAMFAYIFGGAVSECQSHR